MSKQEIIERLKEHLKAKVHKNGKLTKRDKFYCIYYVEDFMVCKRKEAIKFLKENIPMVMNL